MVKTAISGGINTRDYFTTEKHLIDTLLNEQPTFVVTSSITAMSFFNGEHVNYDTSQEYLTQGSSLYDTKIANEYRVVVQALRNADNSATLISIQTLVDPNSEGIVPFIKNTRAILTVQTARPISPALPVQMYLLGGFCSNYDIQVSCKSVTSAFQKVISINIIIYFFFHNDASSTIRSFSLPSIR